jgi:acetyltransferase-like isoleucine patch superfamily enzyme
MKKISIDLLNNNKHEDAVFHKTLKLAPFAKLMKSSLHGNLFLGFAGCINRSELGRYIGCGYFSYIAGTHIGNYCTFGSRVSIGAFSHPTDFLTVHEVGFSNTTQWYGETARKSPEQSYMDSITEKTVIGSDVWVGDNSVIIRGVSICNGAIVAAGSVVTKNVDPFSIVAGNPARLIRKRFSDEIIDRIQASEWWNYNMQELKGVPFEDIDRSLEILEDLKSQKAN